MTDCLLCQRLEQIDAGQYPYAVAQLSTGYVNLMESQYYEGTVEFVSRVCAAELHELEPRFRSQFLEEMAVVAEAVWRAFSPHKLNYEALGNVVPHLHWRIIPRLGGDPNPGGPIWEHEEFVRSLQSGAARPSPGQLEELRSRLAAALGARTDTG